MRVVRKYFCLLFFFLVAKLLYNSLCLSVSPALHNDLEKILFSRLQWKTNSWFSIPFAHLIYTLFCPFVSWSCFKRLKLFKKILWFSWSFFCIFSLFSLLWELNICSFYLSVHSMTFCTLLLMDVITLLYQCTSPIITHKITPSVDNN